MESGNTSLGNAVTGRALDILDFQTLECLYQTPRTKTRPKSVDMSAQPGWFPGFSPTSPIYMGVRGIIRNQSHKGMVVGRWSAEPIKDLPASYYGA